MSEKHVLLRAQVMIEHDGQPYELEVTGLDGTKHRVQPGPADVVSPFVAGDVEALAKRIVRYIRVDTESLGHDWDASEWEVAEQSAIRTLRAVAPPREKVRALVTKMPHDQYTKWLDGIDVEVCKVDCWRCQLEAALAATNTAKHTPTQPDLLRELLYRCVKELDYVQSVENCHSGLCASAEGKHLIELGMKALGVKDLAAEKLPVRVNDLRSWQPGREEQP